MIWFFFASLFLSSSALHEPDAPARETGGLDLSQRSKEPENQSVKKHAATPHAKGGRALLGKF
jgi:hypothetical protein